MSEQLNLELDALRTENGNLKAALQTAERLIGERDQQCCTAPHCAAQRPPYGVHGNKPPHFIWPEPGKIKFELERDYDAMAMGNRDKPLNLSNYRETPRRRRTDFDREAED